jgi:anti-sigma factor RsiW
VSFPATDCARARESLSAQLDGELSEPELDGLELHLLVCPACTAWAQEVRDTTRLVREARLEEPAERFALPRLRRGWRVSSAVAVASAAAVVATMFVAPGQHGSLASPQRMPQVSGSVAITGRHFAVSRLYRLGDGVFTPGIAVVTSHAGFRHI